MNNKATLELGNKPVGKLLMQYSLPAIIAMTASSLYNMVDSISSDREWDRWPSADWHSPSRS